MPYLNVDEVESAIQALSMTFPGLCQLITLPNATHEGRTSHAIRIGLGALDNRPSMLFIGGQHAREWGSCEICINFATDLLEAYDTNSGLTYGGKSFTAAQIENVVEDSQIFIFPCVNPDGRNYSQTVEPMWRKNRNPVDAVDVNRNYDFLFDFATHFAMGGAGVVVSDDPSSDTYHGPSPHSEPETQNVVWLLDNFPQIRWFIDIHSYSELLYHNWGDDENQTTDPTMNFLNPAFDGDRGLSGDAYGEFIRPGDLSAEQCLVERMHDALQDVRGISYDTGQSYELYPTCGTATDYPYSRHYADPLKPKTLGFLIEWGTEFQPTWTEMENIILDISSALLDFAIAAPCTCAVVEVDLLTPVINFNDVPEDETTFRAAVFTVESCSDITLEIISGPTVLSGHPSTSFGTPLGTSVTVPGTPGVTSTARIWISYTGTVAGNNATGTVTIRCVETAEEWEIPITANTINRPSAVVCLVFDQSNSMNFDSGIGPGITRGDVLEFSAPPFVDVIQDENAMAIVTFDQDWHDVMDVTEMNLANRLIANGHIAAYSPNPNGWTSIGEGVARAHETLDPETDFDIKAIVVLTDGKENHDGYTRRYISDVADQINERVYAIGLGTAENIEPAALQALCNGNQGYLLMTGALDASAFFRLAKYYQQILAGVTNEDIILDPEGWIKPGQKHKIPFRLNETDFGCDVILLTPAPQAFRYYLETPGGEVIDTGVAAVNPAVDHRAGSSVRFYRMTLPVPLGAGSVHAGKWNAVIEIDDKLFRRYLEKLHNTPKEFSSAVAHGVRYSLTARTRSNLRMRATLSQNSNEPGATLTLRAVLTEYGVPVEKRATVKSELVRPDGTKGMLHLTEVEPGVFETTTLAGTSGVYHFRVLAAGKTFRGLPFTREQLVTGAVWRGGDQPPPTLGDDKHCCDERLCNLLICLLKTKGVREHLASKGIDVEGFEKCLREFCDDPRRSRGEALTGTKLQATRLLADPKLRKEIVSLLKKLDKSK